MKCFLSLGILLAITTCIFSQPDSLTRTKFVIGISAPELLHIGVGIDVSRSNQIGLAVGVGPTFGGLWPSLNFEHRLYFGKISPSTLRKKYFFRQSFTNYPSDDNDNAVAFTLGIDLRSKKRSSGWTIDLGGFILLENERDRQNSFYPAIRFQYYSYLKKNRDNE